MRERIYTNCQLCGDCYLPPERLFFAFQKRFDQFVDSADLVAISKKFHEVIVNGLPCFVGAKNPNDLIALSLGEA